jgi:murein DD-endopeptidase MepM/ murein hydrolase activator NlpD
MRHKRYRFVVFPETPAAGAARSYAIPKFLPWLTVAVVFFLLVFFASVSFLAVQRYSTLENQEAEVERLRREAALAKMQIYAFSDKVRHLEQEMSKLRQMDRNLGALAARQPDLADAARRGLGGADTESSRPQAALQAGPRATVRRMHRDLDRLLAEASVLESTQHSVGKTMLDGLSIMAATPSFWPLRGVITSYFGRRESPFGGRQEFHRGLDIAAAHGTPILAPADGVVLSVDKLSGYGNILVVSHGYGLVTKYAHLHAAYVEEGERVQRGQRIAAVGSTGRVTGPHLHYETLLNGIHVNPMRYLAAKEQ